MSEATQITRRARSNLAFALRVLPRDRRDDAVVFYAFCRTLDDLADEPGIPAADRRRMLEAWKQGLERGFEAPDSLHREVLARLGEQRIAHGGSRWFASPRRLAVSIAAVAPTQPDALDALLRLYRQTD